MTGLKRLDPKTIESFHPEVVDVCVIFAVFNNLRYDSVVVPQLIERQRKKNFIQLHRYSMKDISTAKADRLKAW